MTPLFRSQAVDYACRRLEGKVIVETPRRFRVATLLASLASALVLIGFLVVPIPGIDRFAATLVCSAGCSEDLTAPWLRRPSCVGAPSCDGTNLIGMEVAKTEVRHLPSGSRLFLTSGSGKIAAGRVDEISMRNPFTVHPSRGLRYVQVRLDQPQHEALWCAPLPCRLTVTTRARRDTIAAMVLSSFAARNSL